MSIRLNEGYEQEGNKTGLKIALGITGFIMLMEFVGGYFSQSLALLSDAGHMLSDFASLGLTLFAIWFATKPASNKKTYGYYRMEILAALFNAVILLGGSAFIIYFAIERILNPVDVTSSTMMIVALIGLTANVTSAIFLMKKGDVENNLNMRSAYLHVIADAFTSIGVIVSGALIWSFGWTIADPIMCILTTLIIVKGAYGVLKNSLHILMEGTPGEICPEEVKSTLETMKGVKDVHDLHVWTISSGFDSLSCHMLVENGHDHDEILKNAIQQIENTFGIRHITIQLEKQDYASIG